MWFEALATVAIFSAVGLLGFIAWSARAHAKRLDLGARGEAALARRGAGLAEARPFADLRCPKRESSTVGERRGFGRYPIVGGAGKPRRG